MLRFCGQSLIEDELQQLMVGADDEGAAPQIWAPVANCLSQANELALICSKATVARGQGTAEEGDRTAILMEYRANAGAGSVALNEEALGEVWESQHWRRCEGALERLEGDVRLRRLVERILLEQGGERRCDRAEILDEAPVVPGQAKEPAKGSNCRRRWPVQDSLNLVGVHRNTLSRNHMSQVGHKCLTKGALRTLQEQLVLAQDSEDRTDVAQVLSPSCAIDQNIVKED